MTLALLAVLFSIAADKGCSSTLPSVPGGSSSTEHMSLDDYNQSGGERRAIIKSSNFHTSDDFYFETFPDTAQSFDIEKGFQKSMLLDDDVFYDAVDYDSASAISKSFTSVPNNASTPKTTQRKSSFLKVLKVFAWKGFGLSFEKSVIQWNAFGAGIRVPVSSNFPEWDRNSALPKLSTTFGLNYPYGCKMSLSVSFPLGTAIYGLIIIGKNIKIFSSSPQLITFLEKLKKQKATDSVKRVGITSTVRYTKEKGLQCYIGPWGFYYPSQIIMQHILPMIFLFPAILVTLIGFLIQHDTGADDNVHSFNISETSSNSNSNSNSRSAVGLSDAEEDSSSNQASSIVTPVIAIGNYVSSTTQNSKSKSILKTTKKKTTTVKNVTINSNNKENPTQITTSHYANNSNIPGVSRSNSNINTKTGGNIHQSNSISNMDKKEKKKQKTIYRPKGVKFYHNSILKWASTKTTGLGYNLGMKYKGIHDASIGSRIVFEIQSFYPFPKTMKKIGISMASFPSFISNYFNNISETTTHFSTSIPVLPAATPIISTSIINSTAVVNHPSPVSQRHSDSRPGPKSLTPSSNLPNYNPPSKNVEQNLVRFLPSRGNQNIQNNEIHQNENSNIDKTVCRERPANFQSQTTFSSRLESSKRSSTEILSTNDIDPKSKKKNSIPSTEITKRSNEQKKNNFL